VCRPEASIDAQLERLRLCSLTVGPRQGFGDRVMLAIANAEPWRALCGVARGWLLPLCLLALLASLWGTQAREVVGAAYASCADPLELSW
jgi:hypothetical protein